jgi:DNA-binding beta-propeller fold protein YncE
VLARRTFFVAPLCAFLAAGSAACSRRRRGAGFSGYAFVANEEGNTIAAVDLEAMAVARQIPLSGAPTTVIAAVKRPFVYALSAASGAVHEIALDRLNATRKLAVSSSAAGMQMAPDESFLFVLSREPRALIRVNPVAMNVDFKLALPEEPVDFALSPDRKTAAIAFKTGVRLVDLEARRLRDPAGQGDFGAVRYLSDASILIAADKGERRLSLYDLSPSNGASSPLITHLPLAVRPDNLCFNSDGGQLFVTGEGVDAVVIVYPYRTPEVAETVLVGPNPSAMAASQAFLFVANPSAGNVSILEINSRKVAAVVSVGTDPGFIAITPDDQYALVLNRQSGDVSVLRVATITKNRDRRASLLTVIPVGSKPVSAAVRAV